MAQHLFIQNTIAFIWDFDKTLIPGYMQAPIFDEFNVDSKKFWQEVNELPAKYKKGGVEMISTEILYLNHILDYASDGIFKDLTNDKLKHLGEKLEIFPGMPEFMKKAAEAIENNPDFKANDIRVEHYVVSTGLRQMILGSKIAKYITGVWGCELLEDSKTNVLGKLGYVIDNTSKTRAIFEINKGANKEASIDVNAAMKPEDRRIPFQNMIYIADGPSDVPVFSLLNQLGGKTYAVYKKGSKAEFKQVNALLHHGRVQSIGEADYTEGSHTFLSLCDAAEDIATRIVHDRQRALGEKIGLPPKHLID
jgi:hypothetical protein